MEKKQLRAILFSRLLLTPVVLGLALFLPAGTLRFWEAWVYIGLLFFMMAGVVVFFLKKNPEVMERRMRTKKRKRFKKNSSSACCSSPVSTAGPPRWDWSFVPWRLLVVADVMVVIGHAVFILVMRENRFLSRTVQVDPDQKVITTGPYAVIRHPMYAGVTVLYLFTPSPWNLSGDPVYLDRRDVPRPNPNEEKVLLRDLAGSQKRPHRENALSPDPGFGEAAGAFPDGIMELMGDGLGAASPRAWPCGKRTKP